MERPELLLLVAKPIALESVSTRLFCLSSFGRILHGLVASVKPKPARDVGPVTRGALVESMLALDQAIDGFDEALEIVGQRNAIVSGVDGSMERGIKGQNVFDGFEKGRRALVEISYRNLQLLLSQRVSDFWPDGAAEIGRAVGFQVIQLTQDVTD